MQSDEQRDTPLPAAEIEQAVAAFIRGLDRG